MAQVMKIRDRAAVAAVAPVAPDQRPRLTWKQGMVTAVLGAWLIGGLFVDGWAHNHQKPESVFTPWHAALYSGFLASAWYAISIVRRNYCEGDSLWHAIPTGHALSLAGIGIFGVGASSDMGWHSVLGIEASLAALLSPTHLVMFCGAVLVLTGPFRAAWADGRIQAPSLRQFLPAVLSLTLTVGLVSFFFQYVTPFRRENYGTWVTAFTTLVTRFPGAAANFREQLAIVGVTSVLITTLVYVAPVLLALRRWRLPFGTATILWGSVTGLVGGIDAFNRPAKLAAGLLAGVAADVLLRKLRPSGARPWSAHAWAAAAAGALWGIFFAVYQTFYGIGWEAELWTGSIVTAMIAAVGASLLAFPPSIPVPAGPATSAE
jgi:hypothetical protein